MVEMSRHQERARSLARFQKQQRLEKENRLLVQLENNRKQLLSRLKTGPGQSSAGSQSSSSSSCQSSSSPASWAPSRSRKGRDKGSPLEPIENFPKGSDQRERLSKSTERDKSKFTQNRNNSTRKFQSQSPSKRISVKEPSKISVSSKRKQEGKQEYQHRNPPSQNSRAKSDSKGVRSAGQYLTTNKTKTAAPSGVKFAPKPGLAQCGLCSRSFAKERIEVHLKICKKTANKKRKPFDSVKARVAGTEAAVYRRRGNNVGGPKPPKSDWRKKRAEFISSLRAAKMAQKFLAEGGNVRDLPPPPPSDTSDYIQCRYCQRRLKDFS